MRKKEFMGWKESEVRITVRVPIIKVPKMRKLRKSKRTLKIKSKTGEAVFSPEI